MIFWFQMIPHLQSIKVIPKFLLENSCAASLSSKTSGYSFLRDKIDTENRRKAGRSPAFRRGRFWLRLDSILPPSQYRGWRGSWRRRTCRSRSGRHTGNRPRGSVRPGSRRSPRTYQNSGSDHSSPPSFCSASRKPRTLSSTSPACGCSVVSFSEINSTPRSSSRTIWRTASSRASCSYIRQMARHTASVRCPEGMAHSRLHASRWLGADRFRERFSRARFCSVCFLA